MNSFKKALGNEAKYLKAMKRYGLDKPETLKTKAQLEIHRSYKSGQLHEHELSRLSDNARAQTLMNIWGIGPWTCDMTAIFFFGSQDVWPLEDGAVQKAFKGLIGRRQPERTASHFSPYRSYLALMMWQWVDRKGDVELKKARSSTLGRTIQ